MRQIGGDESHRGTILLARNFCCAGCLLIEVESATRGGKVGEKEGGERGRMEQGERERGKREEGGGRRK